MDNKDLLEATNQVMPYGKYKGRQLRPDRGPDLLSRNVAYVVKDYRLPQPSKSGPSMTAFDGIPDITPA
jgi:hypothetical protein